MQMTALAITPRPAATVEVLPRELGLERQAALALMGSSLPAPLRTVGALALLLLGIATAGVVLVVAAVTLPVLLAVSLLVGKPRRGERQGWHPVPA